MNTLNTLIEDRVDGINSILVGMDAGFSVSYDRIPKNNVTRDAFIMRPMDGGVMSPTVYLDGELMGKTDGELASFLTDMYRSSRRDAPDLSELLSRERILGTARPKLVSCENAERLGGRDIAYERMLDLLVSYYIPVDGFGDDDGSTVATVQVTGAMLSHADIGLDELKSAALENMHADVDIINMSEILSQLMGAPVPFSDDAVPMWVITSKSRHLGAAAVLVPEVRAELRNKLGDPCYVLPSSIHECIAIPAGMGTDVRMLFSMVHEVNRSEVALEDRLSDNVYIISGGEISLADR